MKEIIKVSTGTDWFNKVVHIALFILIVTLWSMLWYDMGFMVGLGSVVVR